VIAVAGAASLWGLWSLCLRPTGLPASVTSPLALAMIGLCALPAAWREAPARWDRPAVLLLAGNTVCDAINLSCFFAALGRTSVAIAVLTHYLAPILIALAAPFVDGTRTRGAPAAALLATIGLALVLEPWHGGGAGMWAGAALGATSAVAYCGNVFLVRRLAPRIGAGRTMAYHSLMAAALLAPGALGGLGAIEARDLALVGAGSLVLGAFAGIVYVRGLVAIGAARAAVLTFAEPLVAVIVGWVAFGEALSGWAALGGALVLGAGVAVARAPEYSGQP
jgi:drug/metabolite transporter (DMT)-like permease